MLIVVVADVVDELAITLPLLLPLAVVVGENVVVVMVVVLFALAEAVVNGISGTKCSNGGTGLGRRPTHLSHIAPPIDDSPSPRKISLDNRSLSNVSTM